MTVHPPPLDAIIRELSMQVYCTFSQYLFLSALARDLTNTKRSFMAETRGEKTTGRGQTADCSSLSVGWRTDGVGDSWPRVVKAPNSQISVKIKHLLCGTDTTIFISFAFLITSHPAHTVPSNLHGGSAQLWAGLGREPCDRNHVAAKEAWEQCSAVTWRLADKQTPLDTGCHGSKLQKLIETCILTQMFQRSGGTFFFHLQSLHGLKMGEGSRDELGDSVVV